MSGGQPAPTQFPSLIGGIADLVGGLFSARSRRKAKRQQRRGAQRSLFQQEQLQEQLLQRLQPFIGAGRTGIQGLTDIATGPLGQSQAFQEAQRLGAQQLRRQLSSQGAVFSGRQGVGLGQLNLGLIQGEMQRRQQALGQLAGLGQFGESLAQGGLLRTGESIGQLLSIAPRRQTNINRVGPGSARGSGITRFGGFA